MDSYGALFEGGASGEVVYDDGDADSSRLWQLMSHEDEPVMPPSADRIADDKLSLVRRWLEQGAPENSGSKIAKPKANKLTFVATGGGRPEGGGAMPGDIPQPTVVFTDRPAAVTAIAASPWAPLVAVAGQRQIVIYHADNAALLGVLPYPAGVPQSLRFSGDGAYLIAGGGRHSVAGSATVYEVTTGQVVAKVGDELDIVFDADANATMDRFAMGGPQKRLRIYSIDDPTQPLLDIKKHTDWIYAVDYSPDGVLIASADRSGGLHLWEAETGRPYMDLVGHKGAVHALAWRDDSNVLASAGADGTVNLWDVASGKSIKSIKVGSAVLDVAFDHQGRLVTASADNRAKLWKADGGHLRDFEPMSEDVLEVEITHDGTKVAFGDWSGAARLVATEDPKAVQPISANPPSNEQRAAELDEPMKTAQAKAEAATAEASRLVAEAESAKAKWGAAQKEHAAAKQNLDAIKAAIQAANKSLQAVDQRLPGVVEASRRSIERLIASRVIADDASTQGVAGNAGEASAAVIDAERKLIEAMQAVVDTRSQRTETLQAIQSHRQAEPQRVAALQAADKRLQEAARRHEVAEKSANEAKANRDRILAERDALAKRIETLLAATQKPEA